MLRSAKRWATFGIDAALPPLGRRLIAAMLVAFMGYIGLRYQSLVGGRLQLLSVVEARGNTGPVSGRRSDAPRLP